MDHLLKRGLVAYLGFTCALWLMHYSMIGNGAAYSRNPAWQLIETLRSGLTWAGISAVCLTAIVFVMLAFDSWLQQRRQIQIEREQRLIESENNSRYREERARREFEANARAKREQAERDSIAAIRERELLREKRERTAKDAASKALADF